MPFEKQVSLEGRKLSKLIRVRVEAVHEVQEARSAELGKTNMLVNGDMGPACAAFEQRRIKRCAGILSD